MKVVAIIFLLVSLATAGLGLMFNSQHKALSATAYEHSYKSGELFRKAEAVEFTPAEGRLLDEAKREHDRYLELLTPAQQKETSATISWIISVVGFLLSVTFFILSRRRRRLSLNSSTASYGAA